MIVVLYCSLVLGLFATSKAQSQTLPPHPSAYISTFLDATRKSPAIAQMFANFPNNPEVGESFYNSSLYLGAKYGFADPVAVAEAVGKTVQRATDLLSPQHFAYGLAAAGERFLFSYGILTPKNGGYIAQVLINLLEKYLQVQSPLSVTEHYVRSLAHAVEYHLSALSVKTPLNIARLLRFLVAEYESLIATSG